ncbi:MAG: hypothetical protein COW71_07130 [Ignavibacteriales bacterium CG18_big_fil_WC_8_21_14_2_50_31_20]|nr:MAG: hypothetical protein COW71_07130 [Ignavibacteriales bacterium CG18_big_fil_WC_8_21_14_2_50_31_20]
MDLKLNYKLAKIISVIFILLLIAFFLGVPYLENASIEENTTLLNSFESKGNVSSIMASEDFENLPHLIKKYLQKTIKDRNKSPKVCTVNYVGKIRNNHNSEWIETNSTLNLSTISPAFIEISDIYENNPIWERTTNTYINGLASTETKLLSSITLNSFVGIKLNRSYLVLYLIESIFAPTSLLPNINVQWKYNSNNSVTAIIWDKNVEASAVFYFNDKNEVVKITSTDRFMPGKNDYSKEDFTMYLANYKDVGTYIIPTYFEFEWNLANRDFTFGRFQIKDVLYK